MKLKQDDTEKTRLFSQRDENNIKPDYCNAGGLQIIEDGEWVDWTNDEGQDIDEVKL